ncbi:MAG: glycosyltransferase [Chloroflexi bacterium]|nr:glycosyltransferase [Chloroflexota bacterium]
MKIIILSYGSRGDVQPFIALARRLQKNGHEVKIAAPHRFADFVGAYGVPFVPLAGDPEEISKRINDAGTNAVRIISSIRDYIFAIAPQVSRSAFAACEGAELIIHSFLFTVGGHSWAREHGIPDVSVQTFPMFAPTREFPNVAAAQLHPGALSYLSHWLATQAFWHGGNTGYGPARRANPDIPYPQNFTGLLTNPARITFGPRCCARTAQAFCRARAIGTRISMSLAISFLMKEIINHLMN